MQLSKNSIQCKSRSPYKENGGGERDRTDDPLRARQVLSQLSYTPIFRVEMTGKSPVALAKGDGGPGRT